MPTDPEVLSQILDSVRRYVDERLIPAEERVAQTNDIPEDILSEMKNMGLYGLSISEDYGGLGFSMEDEVLWSSNWAARHPRSGPRPVPISVSARNPS